MRDYSDKTRETWEMQEMRDEGELCYLLLVLRTTKYRLFI